MEFVTRGTGIPETLLQAYEQGRVVFFSDAECPKIGGFAVAEILEPSDHLPGEIPVERMDNKECQSEKDPEVSGPNRNWWIGVLPVFVRWIAQQSF